MFCVYTSRTVKWINLSIYNYNVSVAAKVHHLTVLLIYLATYSNIYVVRYHAGSPK